MGKSRKNRCKKIRTLVENQDHNMDQSQIQNKDRQENFSDSYFILDRNHCYKTWDKKLEPGKRK